MFKSISLNLRDYPNIRVSTAYSKVKGGKDMARYKAINPVWENPKEKQAKKYKNSRKKKPLDQTERKKQADMEATLEDSNEEYFILHYKNGNIKATGYILK